MKLPYETDQGIGTRAVLGAVILQTDESLEPELAVMTDIDGVATYHSRIPMVPEIRPDTLLQMEADLPAAVSLLPPGLPFDVIGYGCTSASATIGSERVARAVQSVFPQAKVTDPLSALIAGGKALNARRFAFITPYLPEVSQRMRSRLEDAGFAISAFGSFEQGDDRVVARITEASIINAAVQVAETAPCDAIIISCTNLRSLNVIPEVERQSGIPVMSSNQALAWHMLRLAGIKDRDSRFGQLFSCTI